MEVIDWIVQVLTNLLRFKLASTFDLARMNVEGAETGHPPSRMTHVEASIATLFVHCSHVLTRAFGIKLLDHKLVLLRLRLSHMTLARRYPRCDQLKRCQRAVGNTTKTGQLKRALQALRFGFSSTGNEMNGHQAFYPELLDMNDPHLSVPLTIPSDHKEAISSSVVIPLELWLHLE